MKYINILSQDDDGEDKSDDDFQELINDYIEGGTFEDDNPNLKVTRKELFEENGQLCGIVEFEFEDVNKIGFLSFADCKCAPLLYYFGSLGETYVESDGKYLDEDESYTMPMIEWPHKTKKVSFKTNVQEGTDDCRSLLVKYKEWKATN